ncbi:hypothetical protein FLONG3_70 [Fusarium longipes]|uniref:Uncharacterized protein n=1 Tax=Fusarium longipes TaxID=694270 RepID=A0A395TB58_9HYPO|nr:hypothetical protein FLONG3_70 [Fusarium longipes]
MSSQVFPRMTSGQTDALIVCIAAMLFASFFAVVIYYVWRPRPGDSTYNPSVADESTNVGSRPAAGRRVFGIDWGRPLFRRETTLERNTFPLTSVRGIEHPRNADWINAKFRQRKGSAMKNRG